ncbi:hypothetical protein PMG11_08440 [Penicillium brasilianum]|uniref:Uncharacterized protein n=1 Tax=Penicillium brasilianum TaxID=104259 RepID=A0A0F7TXN4_PENBI|nr:hypothetical protein PMG11_08440 [Penicillium brasilianum]
MLKAWLACLRVHNKRLNKQPKSKAELRRIADFQVLPLLLIGFATYQLDRTNLSSALTGGLAYDLSINQNTINLGNQLMFLGVIALEIPSNVVLYKKLDIFQVPCLPSPHGTPRLKSRNGLLSSFLRASYEQVSQHECETANGWSIEGADRQLRVAEVWRIITCIQKWPHFLATACVFATWSPLTTYTPSIIMSLGFSRVKSNALAAVGSFLTLSVVLFFAWLSNKSKRWGITVMIAISAYLIALVILRIAQPVASRWGKFGLWTAVNGLAVGYHPVHNAWIQIKCRTPEERSISLAMFVMSATSGLMGGSQIFRQDESSILYPRGLLIMIGLVFLGLAFTALQELIYSLENRGMRKKSDAVDLNSPC